MNKFKVGDIVRIKIDKNSKCPFSIVEEMLCYNNQVCVIKDLGEYTHKSHYYDDFDGFWYNVKPLNFKPNIEGFNWSSNLMVLVSEEKDVWND